jgi:hypothetical protein
MSNYELGFFQQKDSKPFDAETEQFEHSADSVDQLDVSALGIPSLVTDAGNIISTSENGTINIRPVVSAEPFPIPTVTYPPEGRLI